MDNIESMQTLASRQLSIFSEITREYENFSKYGPNRWTIAYLNNKIDSIQKLWSEFQANNAKIVAMATENQDHDYFTKSYAANAKKKTEGYLEEIKLKLAGLEAPTGGQLPNGSEFIINTTVNSTPARTKQTAKQSTSQDTENSTSDPPLDTSEQERRYRKQGARITSIQRIWATIRSMENPTEVFLKQKKKQLEDYWARFVAEDEEIESYRAPGDENDTYHIFGRFIQTEEIYDQAIEYIQQQMQEFRVEPAGSRVNQVADIKLPPIEIPKFNGNLAAWPAFKELFVRIIGQRTSIMGAQKLQYLKTYLTGSALNIIRHLDTTDGNFEVAWRLVHDRFDNERMQINKQIEALFQQQVITGDPANGLRRIHDHTRECIYALEKLGVDIQKSEPFITFQLYQKLDRETIIAYEQSLQHPNKLQPLDELLKFLDQRFKTLDAIKQKTESKRQQISVGNGSNYKSHITTESINLKCVVCKKPHKLFQCTEFLAMAVNKRFELVKKNKICYNCLGSHKDKCPSSSTCKTCGKLHNTLLHLIRQDTKKQSTNVQTITEDETQANPEISTLHVGNITRSGSVLLATAVVLIKNGLGTVEPVRALIDQGSQASFITTRMAQQLRLKIHKTGATVSGLGASNSGVVKGQVVLHMTPRFKSAFKLEFGALVLNKLTNTLPGFEIKGQEHPILDKLQLADPNFNKPGRIDILLGADIFEDIILPGLMKGVNNMPMAQKTELGWMLSGRTSSSTPTNITTMVSQMELNQQLEKFWKIEEVPEQRCLTSEEEYCEKHFLETHRRGPNGRYIVRIPLKQERETLGNSYTMASIRFGALERSLRKNDSLQAEYTKFMQEYEDLGHMEITAAEYKKPTYYLPHHAILRPSSSTTKLRVVFDASAKTPNKISFNDIQMVGPRQQDDLTSIIMRWRIHRVVFTADIAKMYRQIEIHEEDQDLQRIIWRKQPTDELQHFKLKTITYGTASAPYLAIRTLRQLAEDEKLKFRIGSKILLRDFYVDDLMSGSNSVKEALIAQQEIRDILKTGGFPIRKWTSNSEELLQAVPEEDREIKLPLQIEQDDTIKALGIHWNPATDTFKYKVNISNKPSNTKRQLISEIAKLFDPVGWVSPVVITAKIMCQKLWLSGIDWDHNLPQSIKTDWESYQKLLPQLEKLRISRWLKIHTENDVIELHGFCDASIAAYAATIYVRVIRGDTIHTQLLTSKTRVAPIKTISLPRLELCGAHLLVKLMARARDALRLADIQIYGWCDSMITIGWIRGHPNRWKTFVANRVVQIQAELKPEQWRYVNTKDNPADLASRGCQPDELIKNNLWWCGPSWLSTQKEFWPKQPENQETVEERKPEKPQIIGLVIQNSVEIPQRFSNLNRLIRVTARCIQFIERIRTCKKLPPTQSYLSTSELNSALEIWIRNAQRDHFPVEYLALTKNQPIGSKSKLISLSPFLDDRGLIRVGGRLENSALPYKQRHPVILPGTGHLTKLIVQDAHASTLHGGIQLTMAKLRLQYWIINGKNSIKWIINKCITCFRFRAAGGTQLMGNLPEPRITVSRPFTHVGVDFAGPVSLKISPGRGIRTIKGYICIFICLATKAMHLEPVTGLSTQAFLATFRRFAGRRGACGHIYSDCGTNFVGASKRLKIDYSEWSNYLTTELMDTLATSGTQWHFIPPGSPHFGGLWEAGVKSMKHHLKRIANYNLTYEELSTVLCQIEGCLNSRPLCPLGNDPEDIGFLTPGHFLTGDSIAAVPEANLLDIQINRLTRWQLIQRIQQEFWSKWSSEYLARLQQRPKWKAQGPNVDKGNLVLVKDEQLPPNQWLLGRITEIHPGKDGLTRVVTLKTKNTTLKRPITKICLLPIEDNELPAVEKFSEPTSEHSINRRIMTRSKTKINSNMVISAILYIITLFNIICGSVGIPQFNGNLDVTPIDTQAGIYFEDIGRVNINSNTWQLIVYYDLENYWAEQQTYKNCLELLETNCKRERNSHTYGETQPGVLSDPDKMACITIHDKLKSMVDEISRRNQILYHGNQEQKKLTKRKRSPLNLVGHIQHLLFGVLDEKFAQNYDEDIRKIQQNENHLHKLLENQTSIAEMTSNVIRKNSEDIIRISNEFSQQLNQMAQNEQAHTSFMAAAFNLILHIITYQQTQDALIGLVLDTQHGRINPLLLSPEQFSQQISIIQGHIPSAVKLPAYKPGENLANLYKLISTKARVLDSKIIIAISIPLINREAFQLFHIIPVLSTRKNKSISIIPNTNYLAITLDRSKYWTMDELTLQKCMNLDINQYMCKSSQPIYTLNSGVAECEVKILSHSTDLAKSCLISIQSTPKPLSWNKLKAGNTWIVHATNPQSLDVICGEELYSLTINGTLKIEVMKNCEIKHASTIINAHEVYKSSLNTSFNPKFSIHDYMKFNKDETLLDTLKNSTNLELRELENFIKIQKQEMNIPLDDIKTISVHDIHHYTVFYIFIVLIIIGCSIYAFKHHKALLCTNCTKQPPQPKPRSQFDIEMNAI